MPWGLVVLAACSWVVYRRARDGGRNPVGWVLALWAFAFVGSAAGTYLGVLFYSAGAAEVVVPLFAVGGVLVALAVVVRAAGTAARVAVGREAGEATRPTAEPPPGGSIRADGRCPHCGAVLPGVWDAFCPECREPMG